MDNANYATDVLVAAAKEFGPSKTAEGATHLRDLELYACKFIDGSLDATCRLNNRDWVPGQKALLQLASAWPASNLPLQSSRQFAMLLPERGNSQEIVAPTFWSRLLGRA